MNYMLLSIIPLFFTTTVYSQTLHISSEQSGIFDSLEYIVEDDIIVPKEKKLKFLPGALLFFKPYAGIKVSGNLVCEGTKEKPIIFTSIKNISDTTSDNYLQWKGIEVNKNGKISFKHCEIHNSLYGIKIPDTSSILLFDSVSFYQNDNQLILNEELVFSGDSINFSFPIPVKISLLPSSSEKYKKRTSPLMPILRYTFLTFSIGGIVGWRYFKSEANYYNDRYQKEQKDKSAISHYKSKRNKYENYSNAGLVCTLISAPALALTITINIISNRKKK